MTFVYLAIFAIIGAFARYGQSIVVQIISVPVGSFAGTLERIIRMRNGQPLPADTGDQGGRQN
jgi:hypothetical protein